MNICTYIYIYILWMYLYSNTMSTEIWYYLIHSMILFLTQCARLPWRCRRRLKIILSTWLVSCGSSATMRYSPPRFTEKATMESRTGSQLERHTSWSPGKSDGRWMGLRFGCGKRVRKLGKNGLGIGKKKQSNVSNQEYVFGFNPQRYLEIGGFDLQTFWKTCCSNNICGGLTINNSLSSNIQ